MSSERDILLQLIKKPTRDLEKYRDHMQLALKIIDIILKSRNGEAIRERASKPGEDPSKKRKSQKKRKYKTRHLPKKTNQIIQQTLEEHYDLEKPIKQLHDLCVEACNNAGCRAPSQTTFYGRYQKYKKAEDAKASEPSEAKDQVKVSEVKEKLKNHKRAQLNPGGVYPD